MARVKRILLEWTHTYESHLRTGIQRVVRNIVNESNQIGKELGVECQPVIIKAGRLVAISKMGRRRSPRTVIRALLKGAYRRIRPVLKLIPISDRIKQFLFPAPVRSGLTTVIRISIDLLLFPAELIVYLQKRVVPRNGDLLLLLDSSWVYPVWPAVRRAKANGAGVGLVIYDIFQITHPKLFLSPVPKRFEKWFHEALGTVNFFICISQTTCSELTRYVKTHRQSVIGNDRLDFFRLGSVIDNVVNNGTVRQDLSNLFAAKSNIYLSVGTIEPRKNQQYLIDAFDKVWPEYPQSKLCIVGRAGLLSDNLLKRIRSHQQYKKSLFLFHDLSDTELHHCYRYSKALVYPSLVEGFGLPIVEALHYKLPVLASDIPIFREVGRDFCSYFDVGDPASLAKMLISIEKDGKMPEVRKPDEYQLPDWKESCRELLSKAVSLCEKN